jgi:cytohesin
MKLKLGLLIILLTATVARAQTNDLTLLLQQGLFQEQANRNLDAAIANYQMLAAQFEKDRQLAATAVFRLGECYRAEGKTNEAAAQYQRILSDFPDQTTLATLSRQDLAGMGMGATQPQFGAPLKSPEQQVIEIEAQRTGAGTNLMLPGEAADAQDREIQRIKLLIQNSPDLINTAGNEGRYPPLIQAAMSDSLRVARYLLDNQANVNVTDRQGETALTTAAAGGHRAIVELLLSRSAEVNAKGLRGFTALHQAAKYGFQAVIETLLANHADVNASDDNGATPLFLAAANGKLKSVQLLLDAGANPNLKDSEGRTALNYAIGTPPEITQALLAAGTNPNTQNSQGRTPLSFAVERGSPGLVKILLGAKADPDLGTQDAALLVAVYKNNVGDAEMLLQSGANPNAAGAIEWNNLNQFSFWDHNGHLTPLWLAIKANETSMAQLLLKYKADPNDVQTDGRSLLFGAVSDTNLLAAMLTAGANPNAENHDGRTPLSFAAGNSPGMVKMLLDAKADPNGGRRDAPLLAAIQKQDAVSVELLLQAGAIPNAKGHVDWNVTFVRNDVTNTYIPAASITPLYLAVSTKQLPIVQLLLKFKADPSDSQIDGWALLFSALTDTNILEAVLDAGANVDPVSPEEHQWTPLAAAAGQNDAASVGILLKHGANPNVSNRNGATPLHWAADRLADESVFRLLLDYKANPNVRSSNGHTPLDELKIKLAANDVSPEQKTMAARLADLLRQQGALDNPPDWNRIEVSRPSANIKGVFLQKDATNWNQFTLLELVAAQYHFLAANPKDLGEYDDSQVFFGPRNQSLTFPDLTHVRIRRPADDHKSWKEQTVDLGSGLISGDCSNDVPLEWGDVVEIPEADHPLSEAWPGFSTIELTNLLKCLTRHVEIIVKGQTNTITLAPGIEFYEGIVQDSFDPGMHPGGLNGPGFHRAIRVSIVSKVPFWLRPVLLQSKQVLSSSDLSRIQVSRYDPVAGKWRGWTVNCSDPDMSDFWLRDGDVIEVPEKQ